MTDMKIKAITPWFGGKRTLAPRIVAELGEHTQYFEPFCGSMAVLFAKEPSQKETVDDLHGDLINLARCIQHPQAAEALYDRLARVVLSEGLLDDAREFLTEYPLRQAELEMEGIVGGIGTLMIERAYWYFLASWMGRNGTAGTARVDYQLAVRWTRGGGSPTVRFRNAAESLPAWHRRLQNVVILRRDAFKILDRFEDHAATAIYADPPYPAETRSGWRVTGSNHRYEHEFLHAGGTGLFGAADDHARLAELLRAYKHARIVVSSYDCQRIRDLYAGWTIVRCAINKNLARQNVRGDRKQEAPEILLINGRSYTQKEGAFDEKEDVT